MSVMRDILRSYRAPRQVMRRLLAMGQREDRALVYLLLGCFLIFVAQWPRLSREAQLSPDIPLEARLGGALLGWLFLAPLFFYLVAALSHAAARLFGGQGSWFGARLALFWTVLAVSPLLLFQGLVAGFLGSGPALQLVGAVGFVAFLAIWILGLIEAERAPSVEIASEAS